MSQASGRTVFVLGKELHGNREAIIVEDEEEYSIDPDAIVDYTDDTAQFPYQI